MKFKTFCGEVEGTAAEIAELISIMSTKQESVESSKPYVDAHKLPEGLSPADPLVETTSDSTSGEIQTMSGSPLQAELPTLKGDGVKSSGFTA